MDQEVLQLAKDLTAAITKGFKSFEAGARPQTEGTRAEVNKLRVSREQNLDAIVASTKTLKRFSDVTAYSTGNLSKFSTATSTSSDRLGQFGIGLGKANKDLTDLTSALSAKISSLSSVDLGDDVQQVRTATDAVSSRLSDFVDGLNSVDFSSTFNRIQNNIKTSSSSLFSGLTPPRIETDKLNGQVTSLGGVLEILGNKLGEKGLQLRTDSVSKRFDQLGKRLLEFIGVVKKATKGGIAGGGGGRGGGDDDNKVAPPPEDPKGSNLSALFKGAGKFLWSPFEKMFERQATNFGRNLANLLDEHLQSISARGYGGSLIELSMDAAAAGMSLQDYQRILDDNMGLLSRSASFDDFQKQLDVGRDGLKKFGIYGQEATQLSAAMAGSAQTLGVPMADLTKSMGGQISVLETLRKTTGMTAEAMSTLVQQLSEQDVVQKELIGLAPEERAARLTQLTQTAAIGKSLGLSGRAADALTDALLQQRKSTVKERFQARGRVMQALSLVGMGGSQAMEAASLVSKRMKTPEEEKRLTELMGEYKSRAEQFKQSAGPGMQYQVEAMEEALDQTMMKPLVDASVAVKAAIQSGNQINENLGKEASVQTQWLGNISNLLEGFSKSTMAQLAIGIPGTIMAAAAYVRAGMGGGLGDLFGKGGKGFGGGLGDLFGKGGKGFGGAFAKKIPVIGSVVGLGIGGYNYMNADDEVIKGGGTQEDLSKKKSEIIGEVAGETITSFAMAKLGAAIGTMFGPGIGTVIGGLIGGGIGFALGGPLGKMASAAVTSTGATKEQTKESKKLTEAVKASTKAVISSDEISRSNIGSLSGTMASAQKQFSASKVEAKAKDQPPVKVEAVVATPVTPAPSSVNPKPVNTSEADSQEAAEKAAASAKRAEAAKVAIGKPDGSHESDVLLKQILEVLKTSQGLESTQTDLLGQFLRIPNVRTRLTDNQETSRSMITASR